MTLSPASSSGSGALSSVRVYRTTNLAVANGAYITWETVDWDDLGFFSAGAPDRLTIPAGAGGKYLVTFNTDIAAAGGSNTKAFLIDGSGVPDAVMGGQWVGFVNPLMTGATTWKAAAGDFFRVKCFWTDTPQTVSGNNDTSFGLVKIG